MIPPVCESDADAVRNPVLTHTPPTSGVCYLLTGYMALETGGGKVINHASHSLVFFLLSLSLSPPLTFEVHGRRRTILCLL